MKSRTTAGFWTHFLRLPREIQNRAAEKYQLWRRNPRHPSLQFKPLRSGLWSVRVTDDYRALGLRRGNEIT